MERTLNKKKAKTKKEKVKSKKTNDQPMNYWKLSSISFEATARIHLPFLLLTLILFAFGIVVLFSASGPTAQANNEAPDFYVMKQLVFSLIGMLISIVIVWRSFTNLRSIIFVGGAYVITLVLLILTALIGEVINNARRWLTIPGGTLQTSEVAKIAVVFMVAGYRYFIEEKRKEEQLQRSDPKKEKKRKKEKFLRNDPKKQEWCDTFYDFLLPTIFMLPPLLLVLLQPHLSGFIILVVLYLVCLGVSGIPIRSWINGGLIVLAITLLVLNILMLVVPIQIKDKALKNFEHVGKRISIFQVMHAEDEDEELTIEEDTADSYQSRQAKLAIASGGWRGVGIGNSRQKFRYLPESHNDYVFAIACEELGFLGGVSIILLFWLFMVCGLLISIQASTRHSKVLAVGYTILVSAQAFLNIAVSLGLVFPTGITLPFFSYGGTANMFFVIAAGMILSVSRSGVDRKKRISVVS